MDIFSNIISSCTPKRNEYNDIVRSIKNNTGCADDYNYE